MPNDSRWQRLASELVRDAGSEIGKRLARDMRQELASHLDAGDPDEIASALLKLDDDKFFEIMRQIAIHKNGGPHSPTPGKPTPKKASESMEEDLRRARERLRQKRLLP
ncbi:MAG: hypothetical protein NTW19_08865 [Planctomycetota bacterium]|nr:hypothetical protein [Planctomycetota bacterium]